MPRPRRRGTVPNGGRGLYFLVQIPREYVRSAFECYHLLPAHICHVTRPFFFFLFSIAELQARGAELCGDERDQ